MAFTALAECTASSTFCTMTSLPLPLARERVGLPSVRTSTVSNARGEAAICARPSSQFVDPPTLGTLLIVAMTWAASSGEVTGRRPAVAWPLAFVEKLQTDTRDGVPSRDVTKAAAAFFMSVHSVASIEPDVSSRMAMSMPQKPGQAGFSAAFAHLRWPPGKVTVPPWRRSALNR